MKPVPIVLLGEPDNLAINSAFCNNGNGWDIFPRYVPRKEGKPGELSYIGRCSQSGIYRPDFITPSGSEVGIEDAVCFDSKTIGCNVVIRSKSPITGKQTLKPIPTIFEIDPRGRPVQTGQLTGKLVDMFCKNFTPISRGLALIRPTLNQYNGMAWEDPRILLCRWNGHLENLEPVEVFLRARPGEGIGVSAPPVDTPFGRILVIHRITWNQDRTKRAYSHYPLLLSSKRPWEIIAYSDTAIVSCGMFDQTSDFWIEGATYLRNIYYDPISDRLCSIVTVVDLHNYWWEASLPAIIRTMKPITPDYMSGSFFIILLIRAVCYL